MMDSPVPCFSILIPSWNNLEFLKLCVESIEKNSATAHQILVFVNEGTDGTLEWVKQKGLDYKYSPTNLGICFTLNALRSLVKTDYIVYVNDDMYVLPDWDVALWREISLRPDTNWFFSSTCIQPHSWPNLSVILKDYGDSVDSFQEQRLLSEYKNLPAKDWSGATPPPNIVTTEIWDMVGGYSVEFSPGMYSDPDFSAKLWLAGVRFFKGVSDSRIYHFETKSTTRIRKNMGNVQFLFKWGITSSTFRKKMMHKGDAWSVSEDNVTECLSHPFWIKFRCRFKALVYLFTKWNQNLL
jgi:glycosyltransferase involved in cell wall biosynthesis